MVSVILPIAGVFFSVGIFAAGCWIGSHWKAPKQTGERPVPKAKKGQRQLELEAEMENFFSYDGSEQERPEDMARKKMGRANKR